MFVEWFDIQNKMIYDVFLYRSDTMNRTVKELSLIALFPALMAATAGIFIPLYNLPPITLQTFFVFIAGFLLKPRDALLSMLIYVLVGVIGVPVFSGFTGGLGVMMTPSGGFIVGFVIVAFLTSVLSRIKVDFNEYLKNAVIILIGTIILYMIGGAYICYLYDLPFIPTILGLSPYLVGDILKAFAVIIIYKRLQMYQTYERL